MEGPALRRSQIRHSHGVAVLTVPGPQPARDKLFSCHEVAPERACRTPACGRGKAAPLALAAPRATADRRRRRFRARPLAAGRRTRAAPVRPRPRYRAVLRLLGRAGRGDARQPLRRRRAGAGKPPVFDGPTWPVTSTTRPPGGSRRSVTSSSSAKTARSTSSNDTSTRQTGRFGLLRHSLPPHSAAGRPSGRGWINGWADDGAACRPGRHGLDVWP